MLPAGGKRNGQMEAMLTVPMAGLGPDLQVRREQETLGKRPGMVPPGGWSVGRHIGGASKKAAAGRAVGPARW